MPSLEKEDNESDEAYIYDEDMVVSDDDDGESGADDVSDGDDADESDDD